MYETGESNQSNNTNVSLPFLTPTNLVANIEGNGVRLNWDFPVVSPTLTGFRVFRNGTFVPNSIIPEDIFTYFDSPPDAGESYSYHIIASFRNPNGLSAPSNVYEILFVDCLENTIPVYTTELGYNYPNPFNPETVIQFSLNKPSKVKIDIYNIRGSLINTLINDDLTEGNHSVTWHGNDKYGNNTASGVYFYRMSTDDYVSVKRMILMK